MELKPANDRGFLLGEFVDRYGARCSIQKSSLATEDCIWLGINQVELKVMVPGQGWTDVQVPEGTTKSARMHLTKGMVKELLPLLSHFVETGELPERHGDPMTRWGPLRGECFDKLGFALLYMDYLEKDISKDQRDRVTALCREVAANEHEPSLTYWERMRERIVDETENMC